MKRSHLLFIFSLILFHSNLHSQVSTQLQPQKRIALIIGNGNYPASTLANPENDARAMKVALQNVGFTVMEYENLTQIQMKKAIDEFGDMLKSNDVGLFFYAGHGIQAKGYNYLIPIDAQLKSEQQVEYDCVQADRIIALMEGSGTKVNIIILDACRNNPFERSWTRSTNGKGLAFMNAPKGTLIAYATSPGSTASDGSGKNGLYTSAILESILIPQINIIQMFQQVRSIVSLKSNDKQTPWESTSLVGDFYFALVNQSTSKNEIKAASTIFNNPKGDLSVIYILLRRFESSYNSLNYIPKSYIDKTYTVKMTFGADNLNGRWTAFEPIKQTEVFYDDLGLIKEVKNYTILDRDVRKNKGGKYELISKTIYLNNEKGPIKIVEYDQKEKELNSQDISLINDSTLKSNKINYIIRDQKVIKGFNERTIFPITYWSYNKEGFLTLIREDRGDGREIILNKYEYLESDLEGNWTQRLEYNDNKKPKYITIREYKY